MNPRHILHQVTLNFQINSKQSIFHKTILQHIYFLIEKIKYLDVLGLPESWIVGLSEREGGGQRAEAWQLGDRCVLGFSAVAGWCHGK